MSATNVMPFCWQCKQFHYYDEQCRPLLSFHVEQHGLPDEVEMRALNAQESEKEKSDGLTAHYYELPEAATELYHLITYKNMNAQIGEIFRACYRYGQVEHSAKLRDVNKMLAYATQEKERLLKYELSNNEE